MPNFEAYNFEAYTSLTNFEILILVLTSLFLKWGQKRLKFMYCVWKVIKGLNWFQDETKLIYQIQFPVEILKADLHGVLEGMLLWRQFFKNLKIAALLVPKWMKV